MASSVHIAEETMASFIIHALSKRAHAVSAADMHPLTAIVSMPIKRAHLAPAVPDAADKRPIHAPAAGSTC